VIVNTVINRIYVEFCPGGTDNYVDYLNYGRLNWICAEFAMTGYLDLRVCCSNYNQMKTEFMLSNSIFFWRDFIAQQLEVFKRFTLGIEPIAPSLTS
jgi:hypothetical protein